MTEQTGEVTRTETWRKCFFCSNLSYDTCRTCDRDICDRCKVSNFTSPWSVFGGGEIIGYTCQSCVGAAGSIPEEVISIRATALEAIYKLREKWLAKCKELK